MTPRTETEWTFDLQWLPGAAAVLRREHPAVATALVVEAFAFVEDHPELRRDVARRAHRFLDSVRDLAVSVGDRESTLGVELSRVESGGFEVLRPLLALIDGQGSLKERMLEERARIDRALARIDRLAAEVR